MINRRQFIKNFGTIIGIAYVAPRIALDAISSVKTMAEIKVNRNWNFTKTDALTREMWAKKWWSEAQSNSYFHNFLNTGKDGVTRIK